MLGRTIGAYRVLAKIGEGGMGTVFVGEHSLLGRRAAIKVLRPEMSANESVVNRFFNEARLVTSISDSGIVQVFDFGVQDGCAYIVMELLEGETLQARLKRMRRLPASDVLRLGRQIATSLAAAHAKNVVHRDLKPDNIFIVGDPAVTGGERAKILDFGIAKLLQDDSPDSNHTQTGMLMGTPIYMSPEQCRGAGEVDHRSDLYSLGCVMFRMLAGRPPFEGRGSGEIIASHLKEPPPLLSSLVLDVPPDVEHVVQQCLAKDPARRPQTALELATMLGAVETSAPLRTPLPGFAPAIVSPHDAYTVQLTPAEQAQLADNATPTTMQGASGQAAARPAAPTKRRVGLIAGVATVVIAAGAIAIVAFDGKTKDSAETVRPMASSPSAAQPTPATPSTATPSPAAPATQPAAPTEPTTPPETVEPAKSAAPAEPAKSAAPAEPAKSAAPAESAPTQAQPSKPAKPKPKPVVKPKPKPAVEKPKPGAIDRGD